MAAGFVALACAHDELAPLGPLPGGMCRHLAGPKARSLSSENAVAMLDSGRRWAGLTPRVRAPLSTRERAVGQRLKTEQTPPFGSVGLAAVDWAGNCTVLQAGVVHSTLA